MLQDLKSLGKVFLKGKVKGISLCLMVLVAVSGCSLFRDYGKITTKTGYDVDITLEDLINDCKRYDVYYGGCSEDLLTALLFDPRDDNLTIVAKDWERSKTARNCMSWF